MTGSKPRAWNSTLPARTSGLRRTRFGVPLEPGGKPEWPALSRSALRSKVPTALPAPLRKPAARTETGFSARVKLAVRKRAGNGEIEDAICEACGRHLGKDAGEFQHRAARGAGGCRDEVINGAANCAFMCPECHRKAESRAASMGMDDAGFWLKHGTTPEFDPRNQPVKLASEHGPGILVWLAADGKGLDGTGYLKQPPEAIAC